ncbi:H+transporting two-sector ATPase E subunit [Treponema brennaborense]|uniref:H+transporting two-sector ATPase E subunit n=1 Tax=Treponema brennaborense (strain DSM 12168 / CIP 105900 / DD5/3) TaxID=906968 RepID=F4LQ43_TREBD|nr:H+transporting two-sector ATPase E subunit [Treponema brennaborense]AEE17121.1 H+transporting two-sector ATPase E subunit [Treponema brennaborense DSM 12168]
MEELRSTEILDKEIHEDARKKAERILANTDAECQKILDDVAVRIAAVTQEKKTVYADKLAAVRKDADSSVPLEKERFLVSFEGKSVVSAINAYLRNLSEDKRLYLIGKLLKRFKPVVAGTRLNASVFGMKEAAARTLLAAEFGTDAILGCKAVPFEETALDSVAGLEIHEGIVLETEDKTIRCRVTLNELVEEILDTHSFELAETLFCGRLPQ